MTSATAPAKASLDPIKVLCWVGIAAYVVVKFLRWQQGATLGELFDFGDPSLWGLMFGACCVGLILRSPKIRRSATLIEANETRAVTWSFLTGFTVMSAYFFLRPVRDSMASDWSDAEISHLWTIQFFLSLGLVMVYGLACSKIRFRYLVPAVYTFYAVTFALFYLGSKAMTNAVLLDKSFYVWVSLFSLFHLSVFWSFMADTFSSEQSKRLFPFIGVGVSLGAAAAPLVVAVIASDVGNQNLMLVAAVILLIAIPMIFYLQRLKSADLHNEDVRANLGAATMGGKWWQGFRDFATNPYLLTIGVFILLYTAMQAFIYFETTELLRIYEAREERTTILALRDAVANILTFGLGLFVTSRLVKRLGMPWTLALLPAFCALGFLILATAPVLSVLLAVDIARRGGEYGITRPAREILFTSVDRETRFKTKPVIDVVVYRGGDAWWGGIFAAMSEGIGLGFAAMSLIGSAFAAVWIAASLYLGRAFERRERDVESTAPAPTPPREAVAGHRG
ncbi:MAG TPA: MFS transporter [Gammaproteobacteria bacterium]|nr:MFS transporter [Gammaproteobacteria bacterium]